MILSQVAFFIIFILLVLWLKTHELSLFQETTIEENPVLERTNLRRTMYSREALLKDDEEDEGKGHPLSQYITVSQLDYIRMN